MSSLAQPFLRELGYVLLQRRRADRFALLTEAPAWFTAIWNPAKAGQQEFNLGQNSPFLENFLTDAEIFWSAEKQGECTSGPWIEKSGTGNDVPLVATALRLESRPVLALLSPRVQYAEQVQFLQRARSSLLAHEKLLREIQKKEILLHCIIHDLSQPLSVMSTALDSLQSANLGAQALQFLQLGRKASQQQENMIRQVLSAFSADLRSTLEVEKSLNTSPDVLKLAEDVVFSQSPPFQAKQVRLALSHPNGTDKNFAVHGEETRLRRIFTNLLENALRYSLSNTTVSIKITEEGAFLKICVDDEGPGLPPDLQPAQIFTLFSKGQEGGGKAGLGLYFCRITVERWGGSIGCESLPQKGARFWFRLPRAAAPESGQSPPPSVDLPKEKSHLRPGLRILFADDQEDIRAVTAFRLQQSGHTVFLAANGEAALRLLREEPFDVVLLDEEMPLMSGVDVIQTVRKNAGMLIQLPIFIAITGNNTADDTARLLAAGFDSVIGKPFRLEVLQQHLHALAGSPARSSTKLVESSPADSQAPEVIDDSLLQRMGGDLKLLQRTAKIFLRDLPGRLAAIQTSIQRNDARALAQYAHALKGSLGLFAAEAAQSLAATLQDFGKNGQISQAPRAFAALKEEIANLEENLRGYTQQTGRESSSKLRKGPRRPHPGK